MPCAPSTRLAKMNGGVPIPGTPMRFPRRSSTVWMLPFVAGLHAQAAAVDAAGEFHVHPLLDRLEEVHHQVMRDVKAAQRQHVLVCRPLAADQFDVQPLFLEESLLDGA